MALGAYSMGTESPTLIGCMTQMLPNSALLTDAFSPVRCAKLRGRTRTSIHHHRVARRQGPHSVARRRSGWPRDWTYCLLSRGHLGRHAKLVRPGASLGVAGLP